MQLGNFIFIEKFFRISMEFTEKIAKIHSKYLTNFQTIRRLIGIETQIRCEKYCCVKCVAPRVVIGIAQ